jgi:hypothetical protein
MPPNPENQDPERLEKESKDSFEKVRKLVEEYEGRKLEGRSLLDEPPLFRPKA